jgi:hypothetical protein
MTAVGGLVVLVGFAGVITWQQWPVETAHKDQEKEVSSTNEVPDWVPVYPLAEKRSFF